MVASVESPSHSSAGGLTLAQNIGYWYPRRRKRCYSTPPRAKALRRRKRVSRACGGWCVCPSLTCHSRNCPGSSFERVVCLVCHLSGPAIGVRPASHRQAHRRPASHQGEVHGQPRVHAGDQTTSSYIHSSTPLFWGVVHDIRECGTGVGASEGKTGAPACDLLYVGGSSWPW